MIEAHQNKNTYPHAFMVTRTRNITFEHYGPHIIITWTTNKYAYKSKKNKIK